MDKVIDTYDARLAKAAADFVELVSSLRDDLNIAKQNFIAAKGPSVDNRKLMLVKINEGQPVSCQKCSDETEN